MVTQAINNLLAKGVVEPNYLMSVKEWEGDPLAQD